MTLSSPSLAAWLSREQLPPSFEDTIAAAHAPLAAAFASRSPVAKPWVVGICGPQGSGKTTLAQGLEVLLADRRIRAATLSLDDFYYTRAARAALARRVHPLFATRGVPGTHEVALAMRVLDELADPGVVTVPRFDKARDDRRPAHEWQRIASPVQLVLFEGWCVGARPQPEMALGAPVNALEQERDPDGVWRRYVNDALGKDYQRLFERLDFLLLLAPPSFDVVADWRIEQEHDLRARIAAEPGEATEVMSDAEVRGFVAYYERLTRYILEEMPSRADAVIRLDAQRRMRRND